MINGRRLLLGAGLALLLCVQQDAAADSWASFGQQRYADSTGRYYVVLTTGESMFRDVSFAYVKAKPGSARVPAFRKREYRYGRDKGTGIRDGDTVIRQGILKIVPLYVRVSSDGSGFCAMGTYGGNGSRRSFVWVDQEGKLRHAKTLSELFSESARRGFMHTASSTWWFADAWIVQKPAQVVIVGASSEGTHPLAVISLTNGKVRGGGEADVRAAILASDAHAQVAAFRVAKRHSLDLPTEQLRTQFANETSPVAVRLRAAVWLAATGDLRGAELLRAAILHVPQDDAERVDHTYAIRNARTVLGDAAIPLLIQSARTPARQAWARLTHHLASFGAKSVPALVEVLEDSDAGKDLRVWAATTLAACKSKTALPALLKAVEGTSAPIAKKALEAAISIDRRGISKQLVPLLDKQTTQDHDLIVYFVRHREPTSVAPLVRALRRTSGDTRTRVLLALRIQTGENRGHTTEAWEYWLQNQSK